MAGLYGSQIVKWHLTYRQIMSIYNLMVLPLLIDLIGRGAKYINDNVEVKSKFSAIG
jgi:hypothetical protein